MHILFDRKSQKNFTGVEFDYISSKLKWQELQNDYRTLIGVTIDKSDVNLPSKISKEEQKNV